MQTYRPALVALTLLAAGPALAAPAASPERMGRVMTELSADAMEGRKPGTTGEDKALAYIEKAFADAGLKPAGKGGWLQPVALGERSPVSGTLSFHAGGQTLDLGAEAMLLGKQAQEAVRGAPVVYAGFATTAAPVKGAVVLFRNADQPGQPYPTATDFASRFGNLAAGGARVILEVIDDAAWETMSGRQKDAIDLVALSPFAIRGLIRASTAQKILAAGGLDLKMLDAQAAQPGFKPVALKATADVAATTKVKLFTSHNVVGRIRGARQPDQAVVYTAHWDSFGHCRDTGADQLCNGAIDNASGIAGLIETARLFKAGPAPDRTVLFVATTAEERGLLGARAYARAPIVPLAKTVAAFNIDTITFYGRGVPAGYMGGGLTTADPMMTKLAAGQGRTLDTGAGVKMILKSSDAWAMLRAGVPAYIVSGAIARTGPDKGKAFLDYVGSRYHGPADEMRPDIPLDGAAEDVELGYQAGLAFAGADARIDFLPGVPFSRPK
jgi:Zn-dependent M28 family amino/carboxypeptidase